MAGKKVEVTHFMYDTSVEQFEEHFGEVGEIERIWFPEDRSYVHITFETAGQALAAVEKLDRSELDFMEIRVEFAKDKDAAQPSDEDKFGPTPFKKKRRPRPKGSRRGIRGRKRS